MRRSANKQTETKVCFHRMAAPTILHSTPLHTSAAGTRQLSKHTFQKPTHTPPPFPNTHTIPHIPQPLPPLECGVTCGTKGTHTRSSAQKVARVGVMCRVSKQTQDQVRAGATHPSYLRITLRNVSLNPPYMLSPILPLVVCSAVPPQTPPCHHVWGVRVCQ